ncbi:hypothetical protein M422DRAFT_39063 [Sphaerobolus stellatus SS14]|uniref:Uncharacterized protein n=1 Tax=Sphaerobolus stellatus (strain SS14) TaxID=990650 RepID=A0A0C9UHI9_SPHS4|nr:hypothetical protein M422DRAFT_39063 [Sphaerobolus stellatus SS14]
MGNPQVSTSPPAPCPIHLTVFSIKKTSKKSDIPVNYTDISLPSDIRMPERPGSGIYDISFHIRSHRYQILIKRVVDRYGNYPV